MVNSETGARVLPVFPGQILLNQVFLDQVFRNQGFLSHATFRLQCSCHEYSNFEVESRKTAQSAHSHAAPE